MPSDVERARDELAAAWGTELGRVRRLVAVLLDADWHPVGELVGATATSRRSVAEVLRRLEPWVELDPGGDRARVGDQAVAALAAAFQAGEAPAPGPEEAVEASMTAIMGGLPAPVRHLDHVPATPATAARRARFLAERFDLGGARVLCLGDHDLTSLALLHVAPRAEVAVVGVDERVLGYVDAVARGRGWRVRTVFADLRVELPRSLAGRFDLVFSDPPYTQAGVRLFLRRGLEALRRSEFARVLFCYGFGERQPALGLKVQAVVQDLRLVAETWRLRVHARGGGAAPAVLVAERAPPPTADPPGLVLRFLVDHRHAVLGNAWREALIAAAAEEGRQVSKNQARQAIAAGPLAPQLQSHLAELPVELLRLLVTDVDRTLEKLRAADA